MDFYKAFIIKFIFNKEMWRMSQKALKEGVGEDKSVIEF